jgi:hypothetical protein
MMHDINLNPNRIKNRIGHANQYGICDEVDGKSHLYQIHLSENKSTPKSHCNDYEKGESD